jgi:hypothetical protein
LPLPRWNSVTRFAVQLRLNLDGSARIDLKGKAYTEVIHFDP